MNGLDLRAYCDESGTQGLDFCIAGYLAPASEWAKLDEPWKHALEEAGLTEFKMRDCEQGQGLFKGRTDRQELQDHFISLIASVAAIGFVSWIDLNAQAEVAKLMSKRFLPGFAKPYLLAFSMELQFMARHVTEIPRISTDEQITFVFDRQDEFAGRAVQLLNAVKADARFQNRQRLGPVAFEDSKLLPPLQAADMLAYEAHRFLRPISDPGLREGRWQWQRLRKRVSVGVWDRQAIETYARADGATSGTTL